MNILLIVILVIALLIYIVKGFMYWLITTFVLRAIILNDMPTIKKLKPEFYRNFRLMFLARVKGDSVDISINYLLVLVYPIFYYFGWNILMYSYVYGEKETSQYLEGVGIDVNMKDMYGNDAAMLRELDDIRKFKRYKLSEQIKMVEEKLLRENYPKYTRNSKKWSKKKQKVN